MERLASRWAMVVCLAVCACGAGCSTPGKGEEYGGSCAGVLAVGNRQYLATSDLLSRMPNVPQHRLDGVIAGCEDGPTQDEAVTAWVVPGVDPAEALQIEGRLYQRLEHPTPASLAPVTRPIACDPSIRALTGTALFAGSGPALRTTDRKVARPGILWVQVQLVGADPDDFAEQFHPFADRPVRVGLSCRSSDDAWLVTSITRA